MGERYPDAYIDYLVEFHATRDYFECHEILEEYWKSHPDDGLGDAWVGLIQLAVGQYHSRRGNISGARKMFASAERRLTDEHMRRLGLDAAAMKAIVAEAISALAERSGTSAYRSFDLPIADPELLRMCREASRLRGLVWGEEPRPEAAVVHRHKLRDRSGVIAARAAAAEAKARARNGRSALD
ncbi:hypothetical protein IJ21_25070 [Paenibacillus sp. 32O-W]|uniref:DUF309 domain-containing protein n=1 Tax=Paenibacillus sp. 32O-W TaxID=1695218 RepID=UPI00071F03DA|nr:DUF309 domain-containing protein [Paenibacillus sp. 32O-W]ALS27903.1 hypothetical protein IJ21_25070 [Paenibacillus sp. 32O-W]